MSSSLLALGIGNGAVVALVLDRSVAQLVAVLGVLQAGAAFQPIDHGAPAARKSLMLNHSEASAVISLQGDTAAGELAAEAGVHSLKLTSDGRISSKPVHEERPAVFTRPGIDSMALLIFTSGTTGTPKGIVYDQKHLMHGVHFFGAQCNMSASSVALLKSPYFWAVMEWEFFRRLHWVESLSLRQQKDTRAQSTWLTLSMPKRLIRFSLHPKCLTSCLMYMKADRISFSPCATWLLLASPSVVP